MSGGLTLVVWAKITESGWWNSSSQFSWQHFHIGQCARPPYCHWATSVPWTCVVRSGDLPLVHSLYKVERPIGAHTGINVTRVFRIPDAKPGLRHRILTPDSQSDHRHHQPERMLLKWVVTQSRGLITTTTLIHSPSCRDSDSQYSVPEKYLRHDKVASTLRYIRILLLQLWIFLKSYLSLNNVKKRHEFHSNRSAAICGDFPYFI